MKSDMERIAAELGLTPSSFVRWLFSGYRAQHVPMKAVAAQDADSNRSALRQ